MKTIIVINTSYVFTYEEEEHIKTWLMGLKPRIEILGKNLDRYFTLPYPNGSCICVSVDPIRVTGLILDFTAKARGDFILRLGDEGHASENIYTKFPWPVRWIKKGFNVTERKLHSSERKALRRLAEAIDPDEWKAKPASVSSPPLPPLPRVCPAVMKFALKPEDANEYARISSLFTTLAKTARVSEDFQQRGSPFFFSEQEFYFLTALSEVEETIVKVGVVYGKDFTVTVLVDRPGENYEGFKDHYFRAKVNHREIGDWVKTCTKIDPCDLIDMRSMQERLLKELNSQKSTEDTPGQEPVPCKD